MITTLRQILLVCFIVASPSIFAEQQTPELMTSADLPALGKPVPNIRMAYGEDPLQFADLRLPAGPGPHPVMILIHGGCWLSQYDIAHIGKLADAFAESGIATWTIEYRRVGNAGGGWPGTFEDIAAAADHLLLVAKDYALDTTRIIAAGHSAGGHLALWLAARSQFADKANFSSSHAVKIKGVLALAPAADLAFLHKEGVCGNVVDKLMGGSPQQFPQRYALGSATELVPIAIPQVIVVGAYDHSWRPVGLRYYHAAKAANDDVRLIEAPESGHFEMINPGSSTWPLVRDAAYALLAISR